MRYTFFNVEFCPLLESVYCFLYGCFDSMAFCETLQYVMGHSDVGVTLNVYTHASYDHAAEQMAKIIDFKEADAQGKQRKSG